jgi:hypothetical protein
MIEILPNETDDRDFVQIVEQILTVGLKLGQPDEVFIIKVDHWFDFKWLAFSHKIFGALGVWREPLRIPPFIPDRIIEELYFKKKVGENYQREVSNPLHIYQSSDNNAKRKIKRQSALFIWYSGETAINSQGSLMVYFFKEEFQNAWYVSFVKKSDWQIYKTNKISKSEVKSMIKSDYLALIR